MESTSFGTWMPGLDLLKNWLGSAGSPMPAAGAWMAPTLDPQELGKRIEELRTVQYWLEQNARLLATTIQTLEVQRMTLTTLQKMNVPMADLGEAFRMPEPAAAPPPPTAAAAAAPAPGPAAATEGPSATASGPAGTAGPVDPMQWWGALTQQFTEIAGRAVQDGAAAARVVAAAAGPAPGTAPASVPRRSRSASSTAGAPVGPGRRGQGSGSGGAAKTPATGGAKRSRTPRPG